MNNKENFKKNAEKYSDLFIQGLISVEEAMKEIQPYINMINADNKKIAKAYGRYYEEITFKEYIKKRLDKSSHS